MSIRLIAVDGSIGEPDIVWSPVANSQTVLSGDVCGLTAAGGLLERLASGGQVITSGGGIWGISINDWSSDASGNILAPSLPTGVDPGVPARLAMPAYSLRVRPAPPIAGVMRGQAQLWGPDFRNIFIQRHKAGTRVNSSLCGKKCDLVWNATTLEWEVDTTATSVNDIVISQWQDPLYKDNFQLWDSATFASDAHGAWICFQIVPAFNAEQLGLRY